VDPFVITCAVTGAETTRRDHPDLPVTPEQIAVASAEAAEAGAAIVHLHVRDDDGEPTQDPAVFAEAIDRIRSRCDAVVEITTGGAVGMELEERLAPLALEPEMASLDCGTTNFGDEHIVNTLPMMREAARVMAARKVRPTLECFDLSHIDGAARLLEEGLVEPPLHYGLVLNAPGGVRYDVATLEFCVRRLPPGAAWTAMGIGGRAQLAVVCGALAAGGHARVGFEDNVYYEKGRLATSNAELVARAARLAGELGRPVATPDHVRAMLSL
jgi:3-keto-5-aminohexanoate cleavage enzyme